MLLAILLVSILVFRSVLAIAISYCIGYWLDAIVAMVPVKRLLDYGLLSQIKDLWKIILASVTMFAVVEIMNLLNWPTLLLLIAQILAGGMVYILMGIILKLKPQKEATKIILKMINKK